MANSCEGAFRAAVENTVQSTAGYAEGWSARGIIPVRRYLPPLVPPVLPTWERWLSMDHLRANVARARSNRAARQKSKHYRIVNDRLRVV